MHTPLCDELGIEFPIFAFTHCRDVVVAVSKAGGFGVLGAVGFTPEQLEVELNWIDEHIGDHPYGVDIVIPNKYEGMDATWPPRSSPRCCAGHGPPGAPRLRPRSSGRPRRARAARGRGRNAHAAARLDRGHRHARRSRSRSRHPKVTLIANALGTPPPDMIDHIHDAGRKVAALCGSPYQALKHADAGVDIIIAQGGEGGGHTGEVGSIVLWPQVVKAVAPTPGARRRRHRQRRADRRGAGARRAGRLDRLAVADGRGGRPPAGPEAAAARRQLARHRPQPRSFTGKPCRMLRNDWTEAWESPDTPEPLRHAAAVHGVGRLRGRAPTGTPTRPSTVRSTRSARSSASSTRSRRPAPSSSAGSRSTSRPSTASRAQRGRRRLIEGRQARHAGGTGARG